MYYLSQNGSSSLSRYCILLLLIIGCVNSVQADSLTWDNMLKYFMYSMASFCSSSAGLQDWTCSWCLFNPTPVPPLSEITIFETPGSNMGQIYGYVGKSDEAIIISFRGSSTVSNWITDFEFLHESYPPVPGAFVHSGFYNGYLTVSDLITAAVVKLQQQYNLPVVCTGHSLGAALTLLTAAGLTQAGVKNVEVWNYGEPRVGDAVFSNYTDHILGTIYRVINQHDIVPHLPPQNVGYHHVAREIWFPTNYTYYIICDASGEDPHCADSINPVAYRPTDHLTYLGYGPGGLKPPNAC